MMAEAVDGGGRASRALRELRASAAGRPRRPPPAALSSTGAANRRVELLDPLGDGRWEAFVAQAPGAMVFHHRAWLELLRRVYGYPMTACCVLDASGTILAGAPLALVAGTLRRPRLACLPFSDHCATLPAPHEDPVLARELVVALDRVRLTLGVRAELRGPLAPHESAHVSARYHAHHIPLERDAGSVVRRFARRARLPRSDGLVVERRTDARALSEFYRLNVETCRREGMPAQPRKFILGLAHLFDRGLGFALLRRDGRRAVAGAVFLTFNGTMHYKYGASERHGPPDRPDDVLLAEAVRWGCEARMRTLDLGRTDIGCEHLRAFKLACGAEERVLAYHELGDAPRRRPGTARGRWVAPLISHSPAIVSRLVGETLCRHEGS
jgi:hypothetical protein